MEEWVYGGSTEICDYEELYLLTSFEPPDIFKCLRSSCEKERDWSGKTFIYKREV